MKTIEYLSPTSISKYIESPEDFYLRYLADVSPPREPQTQAMSVGSAFDAYVKSYLHNSLFGNTDSRFEFNTIFESQVEVHNRDFAKAAGYDCFDVYKKTGALNDLMIMLSKASNTPRFEFELHGVIHSRDMGGVILLGKPDVHFISEKGVNVILDWKVNGYCSQASPKKGYLRSRPDNARHKEVLSAWFEDIEYNTALTLDQVDVDWARQLSIYSWLLGMDVGSKFIVAIDQLACRATGIRIAEHRAMVDINFQHSLYERAQQIWDRVHSNHYFQDMVLEDSIAKCTMLEDMAKASWSSDPEFEAIL